jgi:hypothetical protein
MGRVIQFKTKDSETLDDRWAQIEHILANQSCLAVKVKEDDIELHISEDIDDNTILGLLEIFKSQLSYITTRN